MSVLIKGMEMPSECEYCPLCRYYHDSKNIWCNALNVILKRQWDNAECTHLNIPRREDCPLVEVPVPHGRLIDKDQFDDVRQEYIKSYSDMDLDIYFKGVTDCFNFLDEAPTVIEAEN